MPTLTWSTAADWNNAQSEAGVVHESDSELDYNADEVRQGWSALSPVPSSNLVWYFPLHESSYCFARDIFATASGPTGNSDGVLSADGFLFDGSNDYLDTEQNGSAFVNNTNISFAFWIKTVGGTSGEFILGVFDSGSGDDFIAVRTGGGNSGDLEFHRESNGSNQQVRTSSGGLIDDGSYHFVVITVGGSGTGDVSFYVDDVSQSTSSVRNEGPGTSVTGGRTVYIGARNQDGTVMDHINAYMAEHRAYSQELTTTEASDLYDIAATPGTLTTATKVA